MRIAGSCSCATPKRLGPAGDRAVAGYRLRWGVDPELVTFAPGRATLLGAHIDHQGGRVLAAAIELGIACAVGPAVGREHELLALDEGEEDHIEPSALGGLEWRVGGWRDYVRGVLREIALPPSRFAFGGDLPAGAGLSSSAALEMAVCLAAEARGGIELGPLGRAELGRRVENQALGLRSGPMDQLVSALAVEGTLLGLDTLALGEPARGEVATVLVPPRALELVLLDSGVRRRLIGSSFNDRRAEAEAALSALRDRFGSALAWRDLAVQPGFGSALDRLAPVPARRARHVLGEDSRAAAGIAALAAGRVEELANLVSASQASSRDLWESSIPELDLLAEVATATPGCLGARFGGGGFGGWVAALVDAGSPAATEVARRVSSVFRRQFGVAPRVVHSSLAGGARRLV